ncbi:hypothetical protein RB595_000011 [Gaeumannomyces hyphopodioides]
MDSISFYDIGSKNFHIQKANGDNIPIGRRYPCAVVGKSPDTKAYEIFFYGGADIAQAPTYVLTIPGFRWFSPPSSSSPLSPGRSEHACALAPGPGGRQMIAFGGTDYKNVPDPANTGDRWVKGLQVLDMTEIKWSDQYNPAAKPYQQPQIIREWHTASNLKAVVWDNSATRELFASTIENIIENITENIIENPNTENGNVTRPPPPPPPPAPAPASASNGPPLAAIAGGVAGGFVAWALAAGVLVYFCCYKPKKRRELNQRQQQAPELISLKASRQSLLTTHELSHQGIAPELPHGRLAHELLG